MSNQYVYVLTQADKEGRETCHGLFSSMSELDGFLAKNLSKNGAYHVYRPVLNQGLKNPKDAYQFFAAHPYRIYGLHQVLDVAADKKNKRAVTRVRRLRELYWPGEKPTRR